MSKKYDFDYIVIGSGPAGSTVALQLAKTKKRIALVEGRYFGGTNLNTRDIPYAVALGFAHSYSRIQTFPELRNQDFHFNLPTVPAHQLKVIIEAGGNNKKIFEDAGITCIKGYANFLDPHTIAVGEQRFTANNFILATGAKLKSNEISGTDLIRHYTPETAIKITRLPKVAAIIGGGSTGCEIASYYAELGLKVIILESDERLLPREDPEASEALTGHFTNRLGVTVLTGSKVVALEEDDFSKRIIFRNDNTEKMVRVDCIVLATGSQPNLDYGLENAKVKYKNSGILVNKYFETSAKNIYAIGDALGGESSTDRAHQEAMALANNLTGKSKNPINRQGSVRVTKTFPEVATIGLNEDDLLRRDRKYKKSLVRLDEVITSKIDHLSYGFVKLLADRNNHIIGACIVAPHAELMAAEISLAIRHNLTALELASTPHSINNYSHLIKLAAKALLTKK
ncbi:MAG: NAD(P)/FAD-dependent oxidoreductase [Candidatus Saccharibacteria bacterium]|nr:NAD(P)/FAD-dependent oxidoreductase [Candidatus Saccharibacteria bacterium]